MIHPPWQRFFGNNIKNPPIALNYIASYIRREIPEHTIDIYNADYSNSAGLFFNSYTYAINHDHYLKRLNNLEDIIWHEVKEVISNYDPDIIGISSMTASYVSALHVSKIAKQINSNIVTVIGGRHPTALPKDTLRNDSIDYVVIGEGEETFKELIININNPAHVKGIAYKTRDGEIRTTPPRPYISNLDELPIPVFESSINRYDFQINVDSQSATWQIVSVRGCPFKCIYCASDKMVRFRSAAGVIEEIIHVKKKYNISRFCFEDDSFSLNRARAFDLCNRLKDVGVSWTCNTRIDLIDEELISMMKRSGCISISIGIETGSRKTMDIINKRITYIDINHAINLIKKFGILVVGYFMIGFPWEDKEDMKDTVDLIKLMPLDGFALNIATPLPGTKLFQDLIDAGKINIAKEDWARYHQGSPSMNFSKYSDAEWRNIILEYTRAVSKIWKWRIIKKVSKLFLNNPHMISKKIRNKLMESIRSTISV